MTSTLLRKCGHQYSYVTKGLIARVGANHHENYKLLLSSVGWIILAIWPVHYSDLCIHDKFALLFNIPVLFPNNLSSLRVRKYYDLAVVCSSLFTVVIPCRLVMFFGVFKQMQVDFV